MSPIPCEYRRSAQAYCKVFVNFELDRRSVGCHVLCPKQLLTHKNLVKPLDRDSEVGGSFTRVGVASAPLPASQECQGRNTRQDPSWKGHTK
eukprot:3141899-Amphidinium_carterae.2